MFLTGSLFYSRWALLPMDVFGIAVTLYLHRLYLKENFRKSLKKIDTEPYKEKKPQ
jgi:hypothetical protein